jgi:predicted metal-dependent hydrolase
VRRVRFSWPDDLDPVWTPQVPELAIAANAVSLLMPHAEPYVVASARAALDQGMVEDPDLAADVRAYIAQEAQHHGQHRRFNRVLEARYPSIGRLDRAFARLFGFLGRRSTRFGLAFAAGFETTAFVAARWVDRHQRLLRGGDPTATTMFLWHLAEEVEHKRVAFDLYRASGGGRWRYAWATTVAALVLALGSYAGTLAMLARERRLLSPVAHLRLARWSMSFVFSALPVMVVSALPGHHPGDLADPPGLEHWLDHLHPIDSTVPEYALP